MNRRPTPKEQGTSLLEVLITMVILAFGLLGIAALQGKTQIGTIESYQRAQAVVLLEDMNARINANRATAATYVLQAPAGTDDAQPADCNALGSGAPRDVCEWSNALKGTSEVRDSAKVGAMTGARGCIDLVQAPDPSAGVCRPGIYLLSVAWQGLHQTAASALNCGKNLYGEEGNRRVISVQVTVGLPSCS
ncbi:MAG: type IV pilus modification protein PilV [Pseudomonadota bacterium]